MTDVSTPPPGAVVMRYTREGGWEGDEPRSPYAGEQVQVPTGVSGETVRTLSRSELDATPSDWGHGVGERDYTVTGGGGGRGVVDVEPSRPAQAPASGSLLSPADLLYLQRIPHNAVLGEEDVDTITEIRSRLVHQRGQRATEMSDLRLIDRVLAQADPVIQERRDLQDELRDLDHRREVLSNRDPSRMADTVNDRPNHRAPEGTPARWAAESVQAENERWRAVQKTIPLNIFGTLDQSVALPLQREHEANLASIEAELAERVKAERSDREQKASEALTQEQGKVNGRRGQVVKRLRELGALPPPEQAEKELHDKLQALADAGIGVSQ
jgi:hypothetical protein